MSDLDQKEQNHVRSALRFLRRRLGTWETGADALHSAPKTIDNVVNGYNNVSASLAIRVANPRVRRHERRHMHQRSDIAENSRSQAASASKKVR